MKGMSGAPRIAAAAMIAAAAAALPTGTAYARQDTPKSVPAAAAGQAVIEGGIGDTLFDGAWQFRVVKTEQASAYTKRLTQKESGIVKPVGDTDTLFIVTCEIRNAQKQSAALDLAGNSDYPVALRDSDENSYPVSTFDMRTGDGYPYGRGGASDGTEQLLPGAKAEIVAVFSIPRNAHPTEMLFGLRHSDTIGGLQKGETLRILLTGNGKGAPLPAAPSLPVNTLPAPTPAPVTRAPASAIEGAAAATTFPDASTAFDGDFEDGAEGLQANWTQGGGDAFHAQPTYGENLSVRRAHPAALAQLAALGGSYWNGPYPINKHGDWWIGTAENRPRPDAPWGGIAEGNGDRPQGTLTSKTVRLDKPFLSFQIGGRSNSNLALERVELLVKGPGAPSAEDFTVAKTSVCPNHEVMETVTWDLHAWAGKPVRLRLVDGSATGHLNVDRIQFTDTAPAPTPAPVWGLADTHAHPAANEGFGGQLYWGKPTGDISTALSDCTPGHGLGGTGLDTVGDALLAAPGGVGILTALLSSGITGPAYDARPLSDFARGALRAKGASEAQADRVLQFTPPLNAPVFQPVIDLLNAFPLVNQKLIGQLALAAVGGGFGHKTYGVAPGGTSDNHTNDFDGWPRYDDKIHQHMHVQWIHRAYEGGLRLMVALAVNNELLANLRPKPGGAVADLVALDTEIAAIKRMAALPENASWMEIAYTSADARRIISQNKLALVLGVEVDSFGERKPDGKILEWGHEHDLPSGPAGEAKVENEIRRLEAMGVRHVFPIHLTNNAFGGCSIYEDVFNFNQRVLRGSFVDIDNGKEVRDNQYFGVQFRLFDKKMWNAAIALQSSITNILRRPDLSPLHLAGGLSVDLAGIYRDIVQVKPRYDAVKSGDDRATHGHLNAMGLTGTGEKVITRLMQHGMIIDIDHMSRLATERTLTLAESFTDGAGHTGYPVTSGHSSFRPVSLNRDETPEEAKWPHESDKSDDHVRRIIALGGMVSPITTERDARQVGDHVTNDCAGSDKSWAQEYLYALSLTGGKNIGVGTDMAMLGGFGPRFGTHAAPARSKEEETEAHNLSTRRDQADRQSRGVVYKTPLHDIRPFRWEDDADLYNHDERNAFLAVAAALDPGFQLDRDEGKLHPVLNFGEYQAEFWLATQTKWMINVVKGLRGIVERPLLGDAYRGPDVQIAAKIARQNIDNPLHPALTPSDMVSNDLYQTTFRWVTSAYRQYHEFATGGPDALTRCVTGPREFDFNFDGMAHYGMLPDFLQDLHNIGLTQQDMTPLFSSAEAYIQMWEKCEAMKTR